MRGTLADALEWLRRVVDQRGSPLHRRTFQLLGGGQLASNLGDACYAVALPWYVLSHDGSAALLGTVLGSYGIARAVGTVAGGALADRFRPWTVMLVGDCVRAISLALIAVIAGTLPPSASVLVPVGAILGASGGLFVSASFAIVPALLPDRELQQGNALLAGGTYLAMLFGPALGGLLVAFTGPAIGFAVDAGSFAISALSLVWLWGLASRSAVSETPGLRRETAGVTMLALVRSEPVLALLFTILVVSNLSGAGVVQVALPALAHEALDISARGYGLLLACFGVGALAGTVAAARLIDARRAGTALPAFLVEALGFAVLPYLGGAVGAGLALAVAGFAEGLGNVIFVTVLQRWTPSQLTGRVMGAMMVASSGAYPASVLIAGFLVPVLGPALIFPLGGATLATAVGVGLLVPAMRHFGERSPND